MIQLIDGEERYLKNGVPKDLTEDDVEGNDQF
jgi:hypothetical protein